MSSSSSSYQEHETLAVSLQHAPEALDSRFMFGTPLTMPEISTYELEFSAFHWTTADSTPIASCRPLFAPDLGHLTPISEPSDINDSITPLSLHPPSFDFSAAQLPPTLSSLNTHIEAPLSRPRSSPSTFGPAPGAWTPEPQVKQETGLGIQTRSHQLTPASSPRPRHQHSISSVSDSPAAPIPRRQWTPIAPNPIGLRQLQESQNAKRSRSSDDDLDSSPASKRKRSAPPSPHLNNEITAEDQLLLKLKDEENLTWKEIATRFQTDVNKAFQIPALQMRLKRLRERMRVWTEMDVQALKMAHDYWANQKFEIIASKMAEFGATEKWSTKQCNRKWQEVGITSEHFIAASHLMRTPTFTTSYTSSPIEGPGPGYYPFPITTS